MTDAPSDTHHGKLRDGIDNARDTARSAARRTAETIETNPVGVIVGGLALGALAAACLPRSKREKDLLAPVGKRVSAAAAAAFAAAKEAGKTELDSLGINRDAAKGQAKSLFDGLVKAAGSASNAAVKAGKEEAGSQR